MSAFCVGVFSDLLQPSQKNTKEHPKRNVATVGLLRCWAVSAVVREVKEELKLFQNALLVRLLHSKIFVGLQIRHKFLLHIHGTGHFEYVGIAHRMNV